MDSKSFQSWKASSILPNTQQAPQVSFVKLDGKWITSSPKELVEELAEQVFNIINKGDK